MAINVPDYIQDIFDSEKSDRGEGSPTWDIADRISSVRDNLEEWIEDEGETEYASKNAARTAQAIQTVAKKVADISSIAKTAQSTGKDVGRAITEVAMPVPTKSGYSTISKSVITKGIAAAIPSVTEKLKEAMAKEVDALLAWEELKGVTESGTLAGRNIALAEKKQSAWTVNKINAMTTPTTGIDLKGMVAEFTKGKVAPAVTKDPEYVANVMREALVNKNASMKEIVDIVDTFEDAEQRKVVLADQIAESYVGYAQQLFATIRDTKAATNDRINAINELKAIGVNSAALTGVGGDELRSAIYEQIANSILTEMNIEDRYTAYGNPNSIWRTSDLQWALYGKAAIATSTPTVHKLITGWDATAQLKEDLTAKYGSNFTKKEIDEICTKHPFLATALITGEHGESKIEIELNLLTGPSLRSSTITVEDVKKFLKDYHALTDWPEHSTEDGKRLIEEARASGTHGVREIRWPMEDDEHAWASLIVRASAWGATEEELSGLLFDIRAQLREADQERFDEWVASAEFEQDQRIATAANFPLNTVTTALRDPGFQVPLMAGTAVVGGAAGFALKGAAGAVGGALMSPFISTEPGQFATMTVFAKAQAEKLASMGVADAASKWEAYLASQKSDQRLYAEAIENGDIAGADKYAFGSLARNENIARWAWENKYQLERAGVFDDVVSTITTNSQLWESTIAGSSDTRTDVEAVWKPPDGFVPGRDKIAINGVNLENLETDRLLLPPGTYQIMATQSGYIPTYHEVTVDENGKITSGVLSGAPDVPVDASILGGKLPSDMTVAEQKTVKEARAAEIARTGALTVPIFCPEGWKYQDPDTKEWKSSGELVLSGYNRSYIRLMDDKGYERYTSIDPSTDRKSVV